MMKWVLIAMVFSPFNQPVDLVDPKLPENQFDTPGECSSLLVEKQQEAIEMGVGRYLSVDRYLTCDQIPEDKVTEAHAYYKQDFVRGMGF